MATPSYSKPSLYWRDGAQRSPMPWVPAAKPMTGRLPSPTHAVLGTSTTPETAIALPARLVDL